MKTLLIFLLLTANAFAMEGSVRPKSTPIKPEPHVRVDRHVLNMDDARNDPEVLISTGNALSNNKASHLSSVGELKPVEKIIYKDRLVIDKPEEVKITATWEE